jgi:hypothetical protein
MVAGEAVEPAALRAVGVTRACYDNIYSFRAPCYLFRAAVLATAACVKGGKTYGEVYVFVAIQPERAVADGPD